MKRARSQSLLLCGCLLLPAAAVTAADSGGNYAIWGAGARSCHQYQLSAGNRAARQTFRDFLMGYLTAYNAVVDDTYNALGALNLEQALDWLGEYCGQHQVESFDRAITQLVISRHPERSRGAAGAAAGGWGRVPPPTDSGQAPSPGP